MPLFCPKTLLAGVVAAVPRPEFCAKMLLAGSCDDAAPAPLGWLNSEPPACCGLPKLNVFAGAESLPAGFGGGPAGVVELGLKKRLVLGADAGVVEPADGASERLIFRFPKNPEGPAPLLPGRPAFAEAGAELAGAPLWPSGVEAKLKPAVGFEAPPNTDGVPPGLLDASPNNDRPCAVGAAPKVPNGLELPDATAVLDPKRLGAVVAADELV